MFPFGKKTCLKHVGQIWTQKNPCSGMRRTAASAGSRPTSSESARALWYRNDMALADELATELSLLSPEHRALALEEIEFRRRAQVIAVRTGIDLSDVVHTLRQFARTPDQRLKLGLSHGRHFRAQ